MLDNELCCDESDEKERASNGGDVGSRSLNLEHESEFSRQNPTTDYTSIKAEDLSNDHLGTFLSLDYMFLRGV